MGQSKDCRYNCIPNGHAQACPFGVLRGGDEEKKEEVKEKERRKIKLWFKIDKFLSLKYN
jgi:hypothetical protein